HAPPHAQSLQPHAQLLVLSFFRLLPFLPSSFFSILPPPPRSTLFPYTTLFRSAIQLHQVRPLCGPTDHLAGHVQRWRRHDQLVQDRKSTRLNSSHEWISYAVFCLKKKKK